MYNARIVNHYTYRVAACQSNPVDACADVAQFEGVNIHALAAFLRAVDAIGAHRLNVL